MSEWVGEDMARPLEPGCKCGSNEPALYKCAWKLRRPFMIWAKQVQVGDSMQLPKLLAYSRVTVVAPGYTAGWIHVTLDPMPKGIGQYYAITVGSPVMVMRPGCCEAPCCDDCGQQVDPTRPEHRYCRAHWNYGEKDGALDQREEVEA